MDLCINDMLGVENTKLLAAYAAVDPRVAKVTSIVKHWARRRQASQRSCGCL